MANIETMKNAKKLVERSMIGNDGSHDSWHVWRVRDLALSLAREEGLSSNPDSMEKVQSQRGLVHGKFGKDPTVETSFSSDSEREAEEEAEGERLRKQWQHVQEHIRSEPLQITYNCWDGARHRRVIQVHKGDRIGEFLRAVQQQLAPEFREVRSGPLFHFDVHEDVQTIADATIKKDESHAGKVVERHWYEKNKHIFPASR